jgi:hypothetical protein
MKYFSTLPKVLYNDNLGSRVMTNVMARASVIPTLLNDPLVFYTYDVQDGDTPEIVAYKYYGDVYRYWVVLYVNQMLDPQWAWPLSGQNFQAYIDDKYSEIDPYSTVRHYEKIITNFDVATNTTTTETIIIDLNTYNSLTESTTTYNLPTGQTVVTIQKNAISYYTYETNLNESKRSIKLLNKAYVDRFESDFEKVMS